MPGFSQVPHEAPHEYDGFASSHHNGGCTMPTSLSEPGRPSPVVRVPAGTLSSRMIEPESQTQLRRVSSASSYACLLSVGRSTFKHCRFATTRARLRSLHSPESCETQLMPNFLLAHHRTGPNPALKLTVIGVPRWPSGAGPAAHCAPAVQRVTPLPAA